jgi:hypothetical protein
LTFLDAAVDVGMLCHPGKLTPPAQSVKYAGLIFDTRAEPMLLIPEDKRSKALAMTVYACRQKDKISRLALSVVVGVLESLVEATPTHIGHTYLWSLQETLHPLGWDEDDLTYFSFAKLSDKDIHNLGLWQWLLQRNFGRRVRSSKAGTLVPSMGDGSGTGTGGTVQYLDAEPLDMWMGVWSPRVYHFSSNWKEMRTLVATLERAKATRRTDIANVTFFYFTDNIVTYFAVTAGSSRSPGLHSMVEEIKKLEIELGITLEVVHVPGTTIIEERTNGLSHGIWSSALYQKHDRMAILTEIFAPAVSAWAKNQAGLAPATLCHHLHLQTSFWPGPST